jgi:hypothetical protein
MSTLDESGEIKRPTYDDQVEMEREKLAKEKEGAPKPAVEPGRLGTKANTVGVLRDDTDLPAATPFAEEAKPVESAEQVRENLGNGAAAEVKRRAEALKRRVDALREQTGNTRRGNDMMIQLRKEFLANPLYAPFIDEYDAAIGAGRAGDARKGFFGESAAEKGMKASIQAESTKQHNRLAAAENMFNTGNAPSIAHAFGMLEAAEAATTRLAAYNAMEAPGREQRKDKASIHATHSYGVLSQVVEKLANVPGGATAIQKKEYKRQADASYRLEFQRIKSANLGSQEKAAIDDLTNTHKQLADQVEDASFATFQKELTKDIVASTDAAEAYNYATMMAASPLMTTLYTKFGKEAQTIMSALANPHAVGSRWLAGDPGYKALLEMLGEEGTFKAGMLDLDNLLNGKPSGTVAKAFVGNATNVAMLAKKLADDQFLAAIGGVKSSSGEGADISNFLASEDGQALAVKSPDTVNTLVEKEGSNAIVDDLVAGGSVHTALKFTFREGSSPRMAGTWKVTSAQPLNKSFAERVTGTAKLYRAKPELWDQKYATLDDALTARFTLTKVPLAPKAAAEARDGRAAREKAVAAAKAEAGADSLAPRMLVPAGGRPGAVPAQGEFRTAAQRKAGTPPKGAELEGELTQWATWYNAEHKAKINGAEPTAEESAKILKEKKAQYRKALKTPLQSSAKKALSDAAKSGVFADELDAVGMSEAELIRQGGNIARVESSGGADTGSSSTGAAGFMQVVHQTFEDLLDRGIVGPKALEYLGATKDKLLGMSTGERQTYLNDNPKAAAIFGLGAHLNKLQAAQDAGLAE